MISKIFYDENGNKYKIDVDVNDAALMYDALETDITATKIETNGCRTSLNGKIILDLEKEVLTVKVEDKEIGHINLAKETNIFDDDDRDFEMENEVDDFVERIIVETESDFSLNRIEELADGFPIPSGPLLCLLKASIITTAAQMARCYLENKRPFGKLGSKKYFDVLTRVEEPAGFRRGRQKWIVTMLKCLGVNSRSIAWKIAKRSIRCSLTLGLG